MQICYRHMWREHSSGAATNLTNPNKHQECHRAPLQKQKLLVTLVQARRLLSMLVNLAEVDDQNWVFWSRWPGSCARLPSVPTLQLSLIDSDGQTGLQELIASLEQLNSHFLLAIANYHQQRKASPTPGIPLLTGVLELGKSTICQIARFFLKAWHQVEIDIVLERPYLIEHISALGVTDSPLSLDESTHLICRARRDLKRFYLILDGPDECEETSVAVIKKLLAIEPPLTILVSSRPIATVLATLKDCATVCMPQPRSFNDFLAYATIMLNEYPVIAEHLDHNSENIANAAKQDQIEFLAQAETRPMFGRFLYKDLLTIFETYALVLETSLISKRNLQH
ncbi:hypothetical protein RJZ57_001611 [Blastomyces gilchristii]